VSFPQSLKRNEKARKEKRILANFAVISMKRRPMGSEMQPFFGQFQHRLIGGFCCVSVSACTESSCIVTGSDQD